MGTRQRAGVAVLALVALLVTTSGAAAGPGASAARADVGAAHLDPRVANAKSLPLKAGSRADARQAARAARQAATAAQSEVGDVKSWLGYDDTDVSVYFKDFTLRAIGEHIELWVANDLAFQPGDCRNDDRITVTDDQVNYFVDQFDSTIYPAESEAFSVPPPRDGSGQLVNDVFGTDFPADYYSGEDDDIVVFVDNVRDENYYDLNNSQGLTYIVGFHLSFFNEVFDRNAMTIDAYDWIHRTGANPPNEPVPGNFCESKPARPFLYESTFAHEYQHLLEYYEDTDEVNWVDEGLADFAQTITGYVDPSKPITDQDFDSHIQCILGNNEIQTPANPNPDQGGPENSLTLWEDQVVQDEAEILCDYGAAYTMMEYLDGRYGRAFMSALHREDANGLAGLRKLLRSTPNRTKALAVLHRWAGMLALDAVLDDGAVLHGGKARNLTAPTLDAAINWDNDDAWSFPGAPPNGADFVRLRDGAGAYLAAGDLDSLELETSDVLPSIPLEWTVAGDPPGQAGDPALYSGAGDNLDRAAITEVTVPAADPTLSFETLYETEDLFDYAFVQVSTDGGASWTSLANENTTSEVDPTVPAAIQDQLPGLTGCSPTGSVPLCDADLGEWTTETFDLSAYAGQTVLLSFRYMTDGGFTLPGWWIDDVTVGGTLVSDGSSAAPFRSQTEVRPVPVQGFHLQLVAYTDDHSEAWRKTWKLYGGRDLALTADEIRAAVGDRAETVAAIVMYDENSETITQYAPYALRVNGALQPGGGM